MAKVLLIDDNEEFRHLLHDRLRDEGHDVRTAESGSVGLRLVAEFSPNIVITDIFMPGTEGLDVILALKENHPGIKIIAISGNPRSSTYLRLAETFGVDHILEKPFPFGVLQTTIETLAHQ